MFYASIYFSLLVFFDMFRLVNLHNYPFCFSVFPFTSNPPIRFSVLFQFFASIILKKQIFFYLHFAYKFVKLFVVKADKFEVIPLALKYKEIAAQLRRQILDGMYPAGTLLPTEQQLCIIHGASRQTIRTALQCLTEEGLIQRRQGSGSRVMDLQEIPLPPQRTIAIITTNITDYIFPGVLREAEAVLSANNCAALLYATSNQVSQERRILLDLLSQKKIDGLLVEGTKTALPNPNLDLYRKFQARNIPLVFFHGGYRDLEGSISIMDDNYNGGRQLVEYLLSKGHTRIAGLFKNDDLQGHQRYAGFIDAQRDLNLPMDDQKIFWYSTENKDLMNSQSPIWDTLIAPILRGCTAVVCYNDQIANPLIEYLTARGVSIPKQLAVVSFDNSFYSSLSSCRITSLSHGQYNVGRIAAEALMQLFEGKSVHSQTVPWVLMEKESS